MTSLSVRMVIRLDNGSVWFMVVLVVVAQMSVRSCAEVLLC